jgi:penicillin amidase
MEAVPAFVRDALAQPFFFDVSPQAPGTHPFPENFWALMGERLIPAVLARFDTLERVQAYQTAEDRGRKYFGDNMDMWTWGRAHQMILFHPFIQSKLAGPVFGRRPVPVAGDFFTPKQAAFAVDPSLSWPRSVAYLPSYRQILRPGRAQESQFVNLTGQSGHPLSPHYDDLITAYQNGQLFALGNRLCSTHIAPTHR